MTRSSLRLAHMPERLRPCRLARRRASPRSSTRVSATTSAGRVEVERQRGQLLDRDRGRRPRGRRRRGGRSCPRRRPAGSRPAGRGRGRWCRCRGGRGRSRRSCAGTPVSRRSSSFGSSSGQSPGSRTTHSAPSASARAIPASAAVTWPSSAGSGSTSRGARGDDLLRPRVAADDDRPLDRARPGDRLEHVFQHRRDQRLAPLVVDSRGEALLRLGEALHGEYRGRFHPSARVAA